MIEILEPQEPVAEDIAPGDERLDGSGVAQGVRGYLLGLILAAGLTVVLGNAWFKQGGQTPPLPSQSRLLPLFFPNAGHAGGL